MCGPAASAQSVGRHGTKGTTGVRTAKDVQHVAQPGLRSILGATIVNNARVVPQEEAIPTSGSIAYAPNAAGIGMIGVRIARSAAGAGKLGHGGMIAVTSMERAPVAARSGQWARKIRIGSFCWYFTREASAASPPIASRLHWQGQRSPTP